MRMVCRTGTCVWGNVMMKSNGDWVVADLGLAVSATTAVLYRPVSTAWYRAPEACFPGD